MSASTAIRGGRNIAMKVPPHQYRQTVSAYRALGLPVLQEGETSVTFEYGPMKLHIDRREEFSQAELWLEFIVDDLDGAGSAVANAGFERCDEIEALGDLAGFWVSSPASIIHLVTEQE